MNKFYIVTVLLFLQYMAYSQSPGDTIRVKALDFSTDTRDTLVSFPDNNLSYEKVLLKYSMRCKDALVSTVNNRNLGCGEWDFSCNTYLADSNHVESLLSSTPSHFITQFDGTVFPFRSTPVYDFMRGTQVDAQVTATNSETAAEIGTGTDALTRVLSTDNSGGRSQYLYTAAELEALGFFSGSINGLSMRVLDDPGEAKFLRIRMKNSSKTELNGSIDEDGFTQVYYCLLYTSDAADE